MTIIIGIFSIILLVVAFSVLAIGFDSNNKYISMIGAVFVVVWMCCVIIH